jgi:hypothetical protein
MEIYNVELNSGQMKIEVSIQNTSPKITFTNTFEGEQCDLNFNVFLTAKDKEGRRLWHTPITDFDGKPKVYGSIGEALDDATMKFYHEVRR